MKTLLFLIAVAASGWLLYGWLHKQSTPDKIRQDPLVRHTKSLQADVRKAERARDQATTSINRAVQAVQRAAATTPADSPAP